MKNIIVSTENTCDLTPEILNARNIPVVSMHYFLNDKEFDCTQPFDASEFYGAMRDGAMTRTSMINEYDAEKYLRSLMEQGKDVVHVSFASACSGTVNNFLRVAEKLNKEYSNKVYVVDSMAESGGQGLLVVLTDNFAEMGKSAKEVYDYAMEMRNHVCHYFCVDSIKYLVRGGRVSKVAGFIGSLINIKPVLYTDPEGKLTALNKEITRKRSLNRLVDYMQKKYDKASDLVYITYADCLGDAQFVAAQIEEKFGVTPVLMPLGPVIGSHSGPGTVALFFTSQDRVNR